MTDAGLRAKLDEILRLPAETEWVEFKHNNKPDETTQIARSLTQ